MLQNKEIYYIRMDGATDEGLSYELKQYWWTEWHFRMEKVATLVTSRSSVSSYLNRVELKNGCVSLGHYILHLFHRHWGIHVLIN